MTKGICGQAPNCQGGEILKIAQGEYFLEIFLEGDRFFTLKGLQQLTIIKEFS